MNKIACPNCGCTTLEFIEFEKVALVTTIDFSERNYLSSGNAKKEPMPTEEYPYIKCAKCGKQITKINGVEVHNITDVALILTADTLTDKVTTLISDFIGGKDDTGCQDLAEKIIGLVAEEYDGGIMNQDTIDRMAVTIFEYEEEVYGGEYPPPPDVDDLRRLAEKLYYIATSNEIF